MILLEDTAYIIIHGFAGDISEVSYLGDYLIEKGFNAYCILLKGHGTSKKDMSKFGYKEWIEQALNDIIEIKKSHNNICLIGFSMGGLISINIMKRVHVSKLILINTPVYFWNIYLILKNIISDMKNNKRDNIKFYIYSSSKAPLKSLINFLIILNKTKKMFSEVKAKTLILQCLDDDTVKEKSAKYINQCIACSTIKYYGMGGHQVLLSSTKDLVCEDIYNFISK